MDSKNLNPVGFCVVCAFCGNYIQKKALMALLTLLKLRFPNAEIRGHRDYAAKDCPSFDATAEYKDL